MKERTGIASEKEEQNATWQYDFEERLSESLVWRRGLPTYLSCGHHTCGGNCSTQRRGDQTHRSSIHYTAATDLFRTLHTRNSIQASWMGMWGFPLWRLKRVLRCSEWLLETVSQWYNLKHDEWRRQTTTTQGVSWFLRTALINAVYRFPVGHSFQGRVRTWLTVDRSRLWGKEYGWITSDACHVIVVVHLLSLFLVSRINRQTKTCQYVR